MALLLVTVLFVFYGAQVAIGEYNEDRTDMVAEARPEMGDEKLFADEVGAKITGGLRAKTIQNEYEIPERAENEIPEEYEGHEIGTRNCYTITPNYAGWRWAYNCKRVFEAWKEAGSVYTDNVATIDNAYLIACTSRMGTVGDRIIWYFDDGSFIETIMADTKSPSDPNYTPWGHITGNGVINVLEFEVDDSIHPGTESCIPEIGGKRVVGWTNMGRAY